MKEVDRTINKPIYLQILDILRKEILEISPQNYFSDENKLSKRFNVNKRTLRKSLQILKDEGMIYSIKAKGIFRSNTPIKSSRASRTIGYLVDDIEIYQQNYQLKKIEVFKEYLAEFYYDMVLTFNGPEYIRTNMSYYSLLAENQVAGFYVSNAGDNRCLIDIDNAGIPMVIPGYPKKIGNYFVPADFFEIYYRAVHLMYTSGHSYFALMLPKDPKDKGIHYSIQKRIVNPERTREAEQMRGFKTALNDCGIEFNPDLIVHYTDDDFGERVDTLIQNHKSLTGLIIMDHPERIFRIIKHCESRNYHVPEDLSIVGITDRISDYDLTSLIFDSKAQGQTAAKLLIDVIEGRITEPQEILIKSKLLEGTTLSNQKKN